MATTNKLLDDLAKTTLELGLSVSKAFVDPVVKYLLIHNHDKLSKLEDTLSKSVRARLFYSGADRSEYAVNVSALAAGVEELYRSINFGAVVGVVSGEMNQGINYGTFMGAVDTINTGLNASPFLAIVTNFKGGYNISLGFSLCHGEVGEQAYHGGVVAAADTVKGSMRGLVTYCDDNRGEVIGLVNITGRNGLSESRDGNGRKKKGRQIGLINIDLSKPWYDGGLKFVRS